MAFRRWVTPWEKVSHSSSGTRRGRRSVGTVRNSGDLHEVESPQAGAVVAIAPMLAQFGRCEAGDVDQEWPVDGTFGCDEIEVYV